MKTDMRAVGFSQKHSMLSRASGTFSTMKKKTGNFGRRGVHRGDPQHYPVRYWKEWGEGIGMRASLLLSLNPATHSSFHKTETSYQFSASE